MDAKGFFEDVDECYDEDVDNEEFKKCGEIFGPGPWKGDGEYKDGEKHAADFSDAGKITGILYFRFEKVSEMFGFFMILGMFWGIIKEEFNEDIT